MRGRAAAAKCAIAAHWPSSMLRVAAAPVCALREALARHLEHKCQQVHHPWLTQGRALCQQLYSRRRCEPLQQRRAGKREGRWLCRRLGHVVSRQRLLDCLHSLAQGHLAGRGQLAGRVA